MNWLSRITDPGVWEVRDVVVLPTLTSRQKVLMGECYMGKRRPVNYEQYDNIVAVAHFYFKGKTLLYSPLKAWQVHQKTGRPLRDVHCVVDDNND